LLSLVTLEFDRVDRDDMIRASLGGALHGVNADTADAKDEDDMSRPNRGGIYSRTPSRAYRAAEQA
jgi:hypothetical protein